MKTHKILVVVDCQNDFITGTLANEEAQKKVPNIVKKINEFEGDYIFLTRDTHFANYLDTPEGKKLPVVHCVKNTEGWDIEDSVVEAIVKKVKEGNTAIQIIDKPVFGSEELVNAIREATMDSNSEIEFIGFCTDICVLSNAIMVKNVVYDHAEITVDASCCAGVTPKSHREALNSMSMCQINIINDENA